MTRAPLLPAHAEILELADRHVPKGARVLVVDDPATAAALAASHRFVLVEPPGPVEAAVHLAPSRHGPILRAAEALHDALPPGGLALVADVVWQTAPTPQLAQAFAPAAGHEKVRPVEGYEMQLDHAGFAIVEKRTFGRDAWLAFLAPGDPRRPAIEGDARGAAVVAAWLLRRAPSSTEP